MRLSRWLPAGMRIKCEYNKKLKVMQDRDDIAKNEKEIGCFAGKRCFIIGNGPSVKTEDLSLLKDEIVFTVNDMYLYEQFTELNTDYHLLFDPLYFQDIEDVVRRINDKCLTPPIIITSTSGKRNMKGSALPNHILCLESGFDIDYLSYVGLHIDGLLPYYCTVIQYALSLAIEMGFNQIYLLGCDCTGIQNFIERKQGESPKAYCFEMGQEDEQRVANATMMSSEHAFFEWYHIFKSYRLLNTVAQNRGVQIVDLTGSGILDIFPKDRLAKVLEV